jgi:hypothetical protein
MYGGAFGLNGIGFDVGLDAKGIDGGGICDDAGADCRLRLFDEGGLDVTFIERDWLLLVWVVIGVKSWANGFRLNSLANGLSLDFDVLDWVDVVLSLLELLSMIDFSVIVIG